MDRLPGSWSPDVATHHPQDDTPMAVYTKVFTRQGQVVIDPAIGGGVKVDTFEWNPMPADNALLADCSLQIGSCWGLAAQPKLFYWLVADGPFTSQHPCRFDVSYQLAAPVGRVDYRLNIRLAVPTLNNGTSVPLVRKPGRILIFEDRDFNGRWRLIDDADANLWRSDNTFWDDRISSFVVLSGNWWLFRHPHFQQAYRNTGSNTNFFAPGLYNWVGDFGIEDNTISSLLSA